MDKISIKGQRQLSGEVKISGAKNACLTLMPLSILSPETLELTNVPNLSDITTMQTLLRSLGTSIKYNPEKSSLKLTTKNITNCTADYEIVRKMRASILVLGPLLARMGKASVSLPGGCAIGARPVDLHLFGLEKLGAKLKLKDGYIIGNVRGRLKGAKIKFPFVSVGATENIIMAASLAKGTTVIKNAAREPEVIDLCNCIISMGGKIDGVGTSTIIIDGVDHLKDTSHNVLGDRIEMGTFMLAPAIAGGKIKIRVCNTDYLNSFIEKLVETGVDIKKNKNEIIVEKNIDVLNPINVITAPYPGFPTDLQAQLMTLTCFSKGISKFEEKIFENRFMHVPELIRMGANIEVQGGTAKVTGVNKLKGAPVMATDLRASVSLILAGLASSGETVISRVYHLDRGYENIEKKLSNCGANIRRFK